MKNAIIFTLQICALILFAPIMFLFWDGGEDEEFRNPQGETPAEARGPFRRWD
jgi:hypothetical protein